MPIVIAVVAVAVIAGGAYFFASSRDTAPATITETEPIEMMEPEVATEEPPTTPEAEIETAPAPTVTEEVTPAPEVATPAPAPTPTPTPAPAPTPTPVAPAPVPAAPVTVTESVDVSYLTPARTSHDMTVTLTVTDGIVTDASIIYDNGDGYSNPHQERFDGFYKGAVIGQPIDGISLSRVGGASLTSGAFNDAAAQIAARL